MKNSILPKGGLLIILGSGYEEQGEKTRTKRESKKQNPPATKDEMKQMPKGQKEKPFPKRKQNEIKQQKEAPKAKQYSFFENVYDVARLIPKGRVTSYGAIAKYLGTGKSARTVGYAMNGCGKELPPVPAHRVVNRNGMLTGKHHFNPPSLMQKLLEKEGIKVKKDTVVDFKILLWDPGKELNID
jgi:methylated-DNA-protein-cysteine methyltransferase-like protein